MTHHQGGAMTGQPGTYYTAVGLAAAGREVYVLRDDGEVFILIRRGDLELGGARAVTPRWAPVPAVPGTIAARELEGRPG